MKKRKLRKQLKDYLHAARHARHMREDVADPQDLADLAHAEEALREIRQSGDGDIEKATAILAKATEKVYPSHNRSGMRENVEVLIVALGAAMAIRAFFFQPYKIPTGSMQPTLNGIQGESRAEANLFDRQPLRFFKWLATGATYHRLQAQASGKLERLEQNREKGYWVVNIGGVDHRMPDYMFADWLDDSDVTHGWAKKLAEDRFFQKGEVIWAGDKVAGDHILVNKMKYNFTHPDRGEIAVFDTRHLEEVRANSFYIKRLVGMPGEKIQIRDNRYLLANGAVVDDPPVFRKINEDPEYDGHTFAGRLTDNSAFIQLGADEYMMMGDNTMNSQDGRFFGGVPREDFQGPAFFVYWPFREHWGVVH